MADKEHICARMVRIIEESPNSIASFEAKGAKKGIKVSGGYLRKAAKNNTNIGVDLVDYFLDEFPDINPSWLLRGVGNIRLSDKKHTTATKDDEAAIIKEAFQELREQLAFLRIQNSDLTKALLKGKMIEQSQ